MKRIVSAVLLSGLMASSLPAAPPKKPTPPVSVVTPTPRPVTVASPAATGSLADLLAGKLFPLTQPVNQLDPAYHSLALVDAQGKAGTYMSKGETFSIGGETFLVAYELPVRNLPPPTPGQPRPPALPASLTLINLRAVQAMGGFRLGPPPASDAPATPPAAPGAGQ